MAITTGRVDTAAPPHPIDARTTGLLYLGLAVTGMLGFLLIRPRLFDPDDPAATLANLVAHEGLARAGIALELGLVAAQALVALWFYRLLRPVDSFNAGAVAAFGLMNAVALLGSTACLASALELALDPVAGGSSQLMYLMSESLWSVGGLFFGLWLIPMGAGWLRAAWGPRALGWLLIVGGAGYVLAAFTTFLLPDAPAAVTGGLVIPATAGEFWMIGWLLLTGLRRR